MVNRDIRFKFIGDASSLQRAAKDAERQLSGFQGRLSEIGNKLEAFGRRMTTRVTLPLVALGAYAFDAASDTTESLNKVKAVFGEAATAVEDFAATTTDRLGISRQAALEAAGTFGNFFTSLGLGVDDAAAMSTQLVDLAGDLASFNNLATDDALQKLRAGLAGEIEPLRRLGVSFNAAQVEAKAFELGLVDANGEVTEAAKVQARLALVLEQTTNAHGDAERTIGDAAGQMRVARAQAADLAAEFGSRLIPIGTKLLTMLNGWLQTFNNLSPGTQELIVKMAVLAAAMGPLAFGIKGVVAALSLIVAHPVIAAIAAITAGLIYAYNNSETFRNFVGDLTAALETLGTVVGTVAGILKDAFVGAINFLKSAISELIDFLNSAIDFADAILPGRFGNIPNPFSTGGTDPGRSSGRNPGGRGGLTGPNSIIIEGNVFDVDAFEDAVVAAMSRAGVRGRL